MTLFEKRHTLLMARIEEPGGARVQGDTSQHQFGPFEAVSLQRLEGAFDVDAGNVESFRKVAGTHREPALIQNGG